MSKRGPLWRPDHDNYIIQLNEKHHTIAPFYNKKATEKGWPRRSECAIKRRLYRLGQLSRDKEDNFTIAQLARHLDISRARIKRWCLMGLRTAKLGSRRVTKKEWVCDFLYPSKVEAGRIIRLPHRFHLIHGVDQCTLEWLFEDDFIVGLATQPAPQPEYFSRYYLAQKLGISMYRIGRWVHNCDPGLIVTDRGVSKALVREFLADKHHLVCDASVKGLEWLGYSTAEIEEIINTPNFSKAVRVVQRDAITGKVIAVHPSMTAAARATYNHFDTVKRSVRTGKCPAGASYYFEKVESVRMSVASREMAG